MVMRLLGVESRASVVTLVSCIHLSWLIHTVRGAQHGQWFLVFANPIITASLFAFTRLEKVFEFEWTERALLFDYRNRM